MQPSAISDTSIGFNLLKLRSFPTNDNWYWIGIAVLIGYAILFNNVVTLALAYLNREISIANDSFFYLCSNTVKLSLFCFFLLQL